MAGLNTHSASPLSSKSSQESLSKTKDNEMTDPSTQAIATASTPEADMMEDVPLVLDNESAPEPLSQPINNPVVERRPSRTVPRLDTRKSSITAPLPWKVDETSSPYTPTSHARNASFAPPPRAGYRGSIDADLNTNSPMHKLPPLSTTATSGSGSSSPYTHAPSSPYTNSSSPLSLTSTNSHTIDLSHPPGYSQHPSPFTDRELPNLKSTSTTLSSPNYTNLSPFYSNSSYTSSLNTSFSSPLSPTRSGRGRGILDNDPSIYLSGEEGDDDESMWDTAAKWAKAAGKRLSVGEQTLWKMVNAMGTGDDRP